MNKFLKINKQNDSSLTDLLLSKYNKWVNFNKNVNHLNRISVENVANGIELRYFTDINEINKIENSIVFIDCLTEGIHDKNCFDQYNKSNFYVIFTNSKWDTDYYKLNIDYVFIETYYTLYDLVEASVNSFKENYYANKLYSFDYPKEQIFVSTIGFKKAERDFLVENLVNHLSFSNYVLKYQGKNFSKDCNHLDPYHQDPEFFNSYRKIENFDYMTISLTIPSDLYNQSYFNLVVETDTDYPHSFHPSEKIAKALLTGIPFVVYSTPYFLKNLKELGFTTYDSLWDESYDLEFNYKKRAAMIVDLCNQLYTFNWNKNKTKLIDIANKNAANLLRNNSITINQFEKMHKIFELIIQHDVNYLKSNRHLFNSKIR
jgi:hypothetical protein